MSLLKSPEDIRDWKYSDVVKSEILPSKLDLRNYLRPVRNQIKNSCVAFSTSCIKEYQEYMNNGLEEALSPMFIFNNREDRTVDGMYSRDMFRILTNIGIVAEKDYSIDDYYNSNDLPPQSIQDKASNFRIKSYARISTVDEMKLALYKSGPCHVGLPVYAPFLPEFWRKVNPEQITEMGHAVCFVGYDDEQKIFIIRNSKGKNWGNKGYVNMNYDEFESTIWEAWTVVDDISSAKLSGYLYKDNFFGMMLMYIKRVIGNLFGIDKWTY